MASTSTNLNIMGANSNTKSNNEDIEYYPRHKRAPYLQDISDFGIHTSSSSRHHNQSTGADGWDLMNDDPHDHYHGLDSSGRTPTKSASSSSLSSHNNPIRRRSSFARVFSTLGLSPGPTIAEDNATSGGRGENNTAAAGGGADKKDANQ